MKLCGQCGKEFETKHRGGFPQVYCSGACRAKASRERRAANIENLIRQAVELARGKHKETA